MSALLPPGSPSPGPRRLLWALGASHLLRLLAAASLALPVVSTLSASGVGSGPGGDTRLFAGGGLLLLEALVRQRAELAALIAPWLGWLLIWSFAALGPEWLLLRALGPCQPASGRGFGRLAALGAASWGLRLALGLGTLLLAGALREALAGAADERLPDLAAAFTLGLGLLLQGCVSVLRDLAAGEVAARGARPPEALGAALGCLRRAPSLGAVYLGAVLVMLAAVALGAAAASAIDVGAGGSVAAVFLVHQLVMLLILGARASWLWHCRRSLDRPEPAAQAEAFL